MLRVVVGFCDWGTDRCRIGTTVSVVVITRKRCHEECATPARPLVNVPVRFVESERVVCRSAIFLEI